LNQKLDEHDGGQGCSSQSDLRGAVLTRSDNAFSRQSLLLLTGSAQSFFVDEDEPEEDDEESQIP